MQNFKISRLDDDIVIKTIGSLFRPINNSNWEINVGFRSKQEKTSMSISNALLLYREALLNAKNEKEKKWWQEDIEITNAQNWTIKQIKECVDRNYRSWEENDQYCFVFKNHDGKTFYLPHFELARALFFKDSYLSRTALESDCLTTEFDTGVDKLLDKGFINVMPSSGYTLKLFDDPSARKTLSWVLLDKEARASFDSIRKYQKLEGYDKGKYRRWNFQFDAPPLSRTKLCVRGRYDKQSNSVFIFNIISIHNLKADIPEDIYIYHPEFREKVRANGKGCGSEKAQASEDYIVHDGGDANSNTQGTILRPPTIDVGYSKAFKTSKKAVKKRISTTGKLDKELSDELSDNHISTEEGTSGVGLTKADWNNSNDVTEDAHLYVNKFASFFDMIGELRAKHKCQLLGEPQLRKLPYIKGFSKHKLSTDFNPRVMAVAKLIVGEKTVYLLEVDTSDAVKALSVQLLMMDSQQNYEQNMKKIEWELVTSSLKWPAALIKKISKGKHKRISHPQAPLNHRGSIDPADISRWAVRVYKHIINL